MSTRRHLAPALLSILALGACSVARSLFEERPAHPIARFDVASDARIDSAGGLRGSFVGEGTSRAVHLVSSDTSFIAALVRRYRPDIIQRGDLWGSLTRLGTVAIDPSTLRLSGSRYLPQVASPEGHTDVQLAGIIARGGTCGWRGAQAELIVTAPAAGSSDIPSLRGPVVGSFRLASEVSGREIRQPVAPPTSGFQRMLLQRTSQALDSMINRRLNTSQRNLRPLEAGTIPINTLEDIDAVDILPIHTRNGDVRYAVSLRQRRTIDAGDTVVVAGVMVWDSAGTWQQTVFEPTLLDYSRGGVHPLPGNWNPVYWRRLQAVSGFEYRRDYIWMEQVEAKDGSVLWGIVDPVGNVVVAAAEMAGPCIQ
jgi:hypothetical protein